MYTLFTPSHRVFYEHYFLKSVPDEFEIHAKKVPQECPSGEYYSKGWHKTTRRKVDFFYQACKENFGGEFVFSDVDVQFFGKVKDTLIEELGDFDIACQDDTSNISCSGFFICKCNERTLKMFENMKEFFDVCDQPTLNKQMHICKHKLLSHKFYTVGQSIKRRWNGEDFELPKDILVHHANWVVGIGAKLQLLNIVEKKFDDKGSL